jgi:Fe-S cluster assembly protein SufD
VDDQRTAKGVICGSLRELAEAGGSMARTLRSTLERSLELSDNRLQYWHFATFEDAAVVYVPRFVEIDAPVLVDVFVTGDEVLRTPHLVVVLEEGARAKVIKRIASGEEGEVLIVDADELIVNDAAALTFVTVQRTNEESLYFANSRGFVGRDAQITRTEAALGADFVKTRYESELAGPGADAILNGVYFGTDEQHLDLRTVQRHVAPRAMSRALYKGAVRGESHAIYQGLIQVSHEAVGTDAYLTNNNLILSEDARADSIPSLNISTDDVRCSHGSTTGKLDASQIYYLRTRGYTEEEARLTIVEGFFEGLVNQCPKLVQDELRELIAERLARADDE